MEYLKEPLTEIEISAQFTATGRVEGVIAVNLDDLIEEDIESTLDLLSKSLTGTDLLGDIAYTAVGVTEEGLVLIKVNGDPAVLLD